MATLAATASPMPIDVRLMNGVASLLYLLVGAALLVAALLWLARSPWLAIRVIQLEGDLRRNNVSTIRANATPALAGNLVSIDLGRARAAFEAVPWVRQATLRRVWPDRLAVRLAEHQPVALWLGEDGDERLVNDRGEVFIANIGDVEDEALPQFSGPEGSSATVWSLYRRLAPLLAPPPARITALRLSGRGSWRAELASGATLQLGRGSEDEVMARAVRFADSVGQVTGHYQRELQYADLRHVDGYAVRLRGVTTTSAASAPKKAR